MRYNLQLFLRLISIVFIMFAVLVPGCNQQQSDEDLPPTPVESDSLENSDVESENAAPSTGNQEIDLLVWSPTFFAPSLDNTAGNILTQVYRAFEDEHPNVLLEVQPKAESGSNNLYNYIRTAREVAPSILPDIALIETQQMWRLIADFGLVLPLSREEIGVTSNEAYPFTYDALQYGGQTYGIPYVASIIHMAYFPDSEGDVTEFVPNTWSDILALGSPYRFSLAGQEGLSSDMLLLQYAGAGGQLTVDGSVSNPEALTALYNFVAAGIEGNVIPQESLDFPSDDAVWEVFINQESGYATVRSEQFLAHQEALKDIGYAPIPTRSASSVTIGRVWAFVIFTDETDKRILALDLIRRLLSTEIHGQWSQNVQHIPAHMSAFDAWSIDQAYHDFLRQQMDTALALPNGQSFADLSQRIYSGQLKVLNSELSPENAAKEVVEAE